MFWFPKTKYRDLPVCQKYLVRRELTGISCVFSEAGLRSIKSFSVVSSFGLLYLKFHSPTPLLCVCILKVVLTVFPSRSVCC